MRGFLETFSSKPIMLLITILLLTTTFAKACKCPDGYEIGESADTCRIFLERLPCNTTIPKCDCPEDHTVTPSRQFGYVCTKQYTQTQCRNKKELDAFVAKVVDASTWNGPPESCKCTENFKVSKNWDTVLCVKPHSYWKVIPCVLGAPPACKCDAGKFYGISVERKKLAYNSFYGCWNGKGKVGSCLNEEEIKKYFDDVLKIARE